MKKRNRIIIIIIVIGLVLIAARDLVTNQTTVVSKKVKNSTPDWYMTQSHSYNTGDNGDLKSQLDSPTLKHFSGNNSISIDKPHFIVYDSSNIPWKITALHGTYFQNKPTYLHLVGNVIVKQLPAPGSKLTEIHTSILDYYPASNIAKTKQAVSVKQQDSTIHAIGMIANLKTSVINFLSKSKAQYHEVTSNVHNTHTSTQQSSSSHKQ